MRVGEVGCAFHGPSRQASVWQAQTGSSHPTTERNKMLGRFDKQEDVDDTNDSTSDREAAVEATAAASCEVLLFAEETEALACIDQFTLPKCLNTNHEDEEQKQKTDHEFLRSQSLRRFRDILDKYLEFPTLLDPTIGSMVTRLAHNVQNVLVHGDDDDDLNVSTGISEAHYHLSALYSLSKVRGYKIIQRFLPHDVSDVALIWKALERETDRENKLMRNGTSSTIRAPQENNSTEENGSYGSVPSPPVWESIYMLWRWMSVLSLVPFDCSVMVADEHQWVTSFLRYAKDALCQAGPTRHAAASCLASWLVRPDFEQKYLPDVIGWTKQIVQDYVQPAAVTETASKPPSQQAFPGSSLFRVLGALQTVTAILKHSPRQQGESLQFITDQLWNPLLALARTNQPTSPSSLSSYSSAADHNNILVVKMLVKWWTRSCCCAHSLPPRTVASWRYQRGKRSLHENLLQSAASGNVPTVATELKLTPPSNSIHQEISHAVEEQEEFLFVVPDHVEVAMGRLLEALGHSSTVVRWSAAKGIGRVTNRLPSLCAHDVIDAVLEFFDDIDKDHYWHGACLALAELARHGLLLPSRLADVVPFVTRAVHYDVQRGRSSVGANVRDAACYAFWAFARVYDPVILQPYLKALTEAILLTALFDREINCRRAASAAFQEAVGRQGAINFPHGLEILTTADYFSLGNRQEAYTSIARSIAEFDAYRRPIIRHLVEVKLSHWDSRIRGLASKSLYKLTDLDPSLMGRIILPSLLERSLDPQTVQLRHGAVLGVAEILLRLSETKALGSCVSDQSVKDLIALAPEIDKRRLYRGRGGELMRSAVCRLVECISRAAVVLTVPEQVKLLDSIDACIPHPSEEIQEQACAALDWLLSTYFPVSEDGPSPRLQARVVDKFIGQVNTSDNPAATRGYALALGYLPAKLLAPSPSVLDAILKCLQRSARYNTLVCGEPDAETRKNSVKAMAKVVKTVGFGQQTQLGYPVVGLDHRLLSTVCDTYFLALKDYRSDRRGDVGSWSRMFAMKAAVSLLLDLANGPDTSAFFSETDTATDFVGAMLKQLSEKLDTVRICAGESLSNLLLSSQPCVPGIALQSELVTKLELSAEMVPSKWADPWFTFPKVMSIASLPNEAYMKCVISGIILSVGDLTEAVTKSASACLLDWAKHEKGTDRISKLGSIIISLLTEFRGNGRVVLPALKTATLLLSNRCLDEIMQADEPFSASMIAKIIDAERGCSDIHRLKALISVAVELLNASSSEMKQVREQALAFLCRMLAHRFPRVRSYAAEQLYVVLINQAELLGAGDIPLEVILTTPWGSDGLDAEPIVAKIANNLALDNSMVLV